MVEKPRQLEKRPHTPCSDLTFLHVVTAFGHAQTHTLNVEICTIQKDVNQPHLKIQCLGLIHETSVLVSRKHGFNAHRLMGADRSFQPALNALHRLQVCLCEDNAFDVNDPFGEQVRIDDPNGTTELLYLGATV
jgi:hypothetical protein